MKTGIIILAAAILAGCGAEAKKATQTVLLNVYKTPTGRGCAEGDWDRQFLHGRKPGEEECRVAGHSAQAVPVDPRWQQQADCNVLRAYLRNKKFSDMTPNDLSDIEACRGI